jgi:DNA-binding GntR family transcriptional regulator
MLAATNTRHPTLVDRLVGHIYDRIVRGELKAGQRITEEELAGEFGVSRTPVREAVKRLAELGVVVVYPRARLEVATATPQDVWQIAQFRLDLECLALRYAMPRISDDDISHLETLARRCQRFAEAGNRIQTFRTDSEFHLAIAALSGNPHLLEALRRLNLKVQLCRATVCLSRQKILSNVQFHERILEAIRRRDVKQATAMMRQHIESTLQDDAGDLT